MAFALPNKSSANAPWACHTDPVRLSASLIQRVALIVLLAFSVTRLVDAHLHVCLDGQEAPLTVHTADGSVHNDAHHQEQQHDDRDVEYLEAIFVKKAGPDVQLFITVISFVAVALAPSRFTRNSLPPPLPPFQSFFQLRPPLRGPPL
jgi:hypothetical protein